MVHMGGLGGTIVLQSVDGKGTRTSAFQATQRCIITDDGLVQPKKMEKKGFVHCSYYNSEYVFFSSLLLYCVPHIGPFTADLNSITRLTLFFLQSHNEEVREATQEIFKYAFSMFLTDPNVCRTIIVA